MAKQNHNDYNESDKEFIHDEMSNELDLLEDVSATELARFTEYSSLFDHPQIKEIIPDFYAGRDLIGSVIAIWSWEWRESRSFGDFIVAECELPGENERIRVGFSSLPIKTIFRGLEGKNVPKPFVVAIERANQTYTFTDAKAFLASRKK